MKNFLQKNTVIVASFLSAVILVLQQALSSNQTDWQAISFAVLLAVLGVAARNFKMKGFTLLGIFGTLAGSFHDIWSTGTFTWNEFILSSIVAVLLAALGHVGTQATPAEAKQ